MRKRKLKRRKKFLITPKGELSPEWAAIRMEAMNTLGGGRCADLLQTRLSRSTALRILRGEIEPRYSDGVLLEAAVTGEPVISLDHLRYVVKHGRGKSSLLMLAQDLGIPYQSLYGWIEKGREPSFGAGAFLKHALPVEMPRWEETSNEYLKQSKN